MAMAGRETNIKIEQLKQYRDTVKEIDKEGVAVRTQDKVRRRTSI